MFRIALVSLSLAATAAVTTGCGAGADDPGTPDATTPTRSQAFGPQGYAGVDIGMDAAAARGAGAKVGHLKGESCAGLVLPGAKRLRHRVDGWVSAKVGVALITTTDRKAATPEGMRVGMTQAQVHAIYPTAQDQPDFWRVAVPGHPGLSYWWGYAEHARVGALTIVSDRQDCVN
ncbi:hypothetical protein [Nocardioides montaniterrae]